MTATSVVPPPMSTTMLPVGSWIGSPAPIAAAIGSSMMYARREPAAMVASSTARCSTPVIPDGTQTTTRGFARRRRLCTRLDEVAEHLLGDVEVGDHAVLQRADRLDVARGAADHALGLGADGQDRAGQRVDRDDGGLVEHDASSAYVDERVRGPEVDRHVATKEPQNPFCTLGFGRGDEDR